MKRVSALLGSGAIVLLVPAAAPAASLSDVDRLLLTEKAPSFLEMGACGGEVRALRVRLARAGYLGEHAGRGRCFDEMTWHAVMAFQKWSQIGADGIVGPETTVALRSIARPAPLTAGEGERIEISISRQVALVVRDNRVLRAVSISSGAPGWDTPTGTFEVYLKDPDAYSYKYDAPMPLASFFNGDIGLHESSDVPGYPASHGCVRVPAGFAQRLYDFVELGTPVVVVS